jgi:hypothetical protein
MARVGAGVGGGGGPQDGPSRDTGSTDDDVIDADFDRS